MSQDGSTPDGPSLPPDKTAQEHQVVDESGLGQENMKLEKIKTPKLPALPTGLGWPRISTQGGRGRWILASALEHQAALALFPGNPWYC